MVRALSHPAGRLATLGAKLWLCAAIAAATQSAFAQQLPVRRYDIADGLPNSKVNAIHQDAKGYLWLGTFYGLSRFDGYRFTNYQTEDGLGHPVVNAITEDRQGRLWVSTNGGGVARLIDSPAELAAGRPDTGEARQKLVNYRLASSGNANFVNAIIFDADNNLWCATDEGLYRAALGPGLEPRFEYVASGSYSEAFADSQGRIWFRSGERGLVQLVAGRLVERMARDKTGGYDVLGITEDGAGRLLAATLRGLVEFRDEEFHVARGLPLLLNSDHHIRALLSDSSGAMWVGTTNGLLKLKDGRQTLYSMAQGLSDNRIESLYEDREGNVWIGTARAGLCKLSGAPVASFTTAEGLPSPHVVKVIEAKDGAIYALTADGQLARIRDDKVTTVNAPFAPDLADARRGLLYSRQGEWWVSSRQGVSRAGGPVLALPETRDQWRSLLYEDAAGDILCVVQNSVYRLQPTDKGARIRDKTPLGDELAGQTVLAMISDPAGSLWVATHNKIARMSGGAFRALPAADGLPETQARTFFVDSRGWLWLGLRFQGLSVTRDPAAEHPQFTNYSVRTGLLDNSVSSIGEDDFGTIYVGTPKGLSLIEPTTGQIRHITPADGLAGTEVRDCIRDGRGNIWVATTRGVSRLSQRAESRDREPPPIYLSRVQVAGEDLPLWETGSLRVPEVRLSASQNNLLIEYVGLSFRNETALKYQYKLDGVDEDWSKPAEQRSLNFARLAPGTYRFSVRAVDEDGRVSVEPARLEFYIAAPVWQRWWFLAGALLLAGSAAYSFYRYRVAHLIELERVRTRIATDLHDDIGSNLSRIAILSEVVSHEVGEAHPGAREPLAAIATSSRELVDSMSDIVWAINPRRDQLSDLVQRMRRFASDVFTARDIEFRFHAPGGDAQVKVGADVRRQVFLIFRECVNNIARHSACTAVDIELELTGSWLWLTVKDNGKGFEAGRAGDGDGLKNMAARARELSGEVRITSSPGAGTTVFLKAPLVARSAPPSPRARRLSRTS